MVGAGAVGKDGGSFICPGRSSWPRLCLTWLGSGCSCSSGGSDGVGRCCKKAAKRKEVAVMGARSALAFAAVAALALANCWFFLSFAPLRQEEEKHARGGDVSDAFVSPPFTSSSSALSSSPSAVAPPPDADVRAPIEDPTPAQGSSATLNSGSSFLPTDPPQETDHSPAPEARDVSNDPISRITSPGECDVSAGRWIPDSGRVPLYTNETCAYIQPSQNCMMNGRPDRGYLNWRWKPHGCELPDLDPERFLDTMRGKKMVFIGDSIARNHMQSLLCALAQVEEPEKFFFDADDKVMKWRFPSHDFMLNHLWSPFLAQHDFVNEVYHIHLDVPEPVWGSEIRDYDVAVLSSGYWFFRPSIYYSNNTILGCNPRSHLNYTIFEVLPAYRLAHRNILRFMSRKFKGVTVLRTITVDHFEYGSWNTGGLCNRTSPFDEVPGLELPWMSNEMNLIQVEEFERASREGGRGRMAVMNVTWSAFLRPDGHPNTHRIQPPNERPQNDCLHWCLPGPIDTWNQILFHVVETKMGDASGTKLTQFNKLRGG